jgi:hypothetical protein
MVESKDERTSAENASLRGVVFVGGRRPEFQIFPDPAPSPSEVPGDLSPYSRVATPRGTEYCSHQTQTSV